MRKEEPEHAMHLTGTFDLLDLEETLALLGRRAATGHLHVRLAKASATLGLVDGRVVDAKPSNGNGIAGHLADWHEVAEELCFRALRDQRGSFEFVPAQAVDPMPGEPMTTEQLTRAAHRRAERWAAIEAVIPSGDVIPRVAKALRDERLTLGREQWRLLRTIDGRRTVTAIARRLDVGLLTCCELLAPLIEAGAVELPPAPEPIASPPAPVLRLAADLPAGAEQPSNADADAPEPEDPGTPRLFAGVRILGRRPRPTSTAAAS